ncbi:MAG: succinyl-diaminopimelate desuccinylase [Actinomycetota bacterium]
MTSVDLRAPARDLTVDLVDMESVSGDEAAITDAIEAGLRSAAHLTVERDGNVLVARTSLGRDRRILLAGHTDTVPLAANLPARLDGDRLYGCGATDMKGGLAVLLSIATQVTTPRHDVTYVAYDCEEVNAARNGLKRVVESHPEWLATDLAILMEPTNALIEAGCQGTLRVEVTVPGVRAHSARAWTGVNAIHGAAPLLATLAAYDARRVVIDGCEFREGLSAVRIHGGVSGNVVPDECVVEINFRFAPDRSESDALVHVQQVLSPYQVSLVDVAGGALPGLSSAVAAEFAAAVGGAPQAKLGWTDVARFSALGVPALNFGPGDPLVAHTADEYVDLPQVDRAYDILHRYLSG